MNDSIKVWHLNNFSLFKDTPKALIKEVSEKTSMREVPKNEFIYFEDDPPDTIYFLKKGKVKVGTYSNDGKEVIKTILQPGEIFGELSIMGDSNRNEFSEVLEDAQVCKISRQDFESLMERYGNLSLKVSKIMGFRLKKVERRLASLVFKDARTRIIEFLKDIAEEQGEKVGFETMIKNYFTHQDIANLTGTTRQTVTEVLNDLRRQNLINFDRRQILIRNLEQLA